MQHPQISCADLSACPDGTQTPVAPAAEAALLCAKEAIRSPNIAGCCTECHMNGCERATSHGRSLCANSGENSGEDSGENRRFKGCVPDCG